MSSNSFFNKQYLVIYFTPISCTATVKFLFSFTIHEIMCLPWGILLINLVFWCLELHFPFLLLCHFWSTFYKLFAEIRMFQCNIHCYSFFWVRFKHLFDQIHSLVRCFVKIKNSKINIALFIQSKCLVMVLTRKQLFQRNSRTNIFLVFTAYRKQLQY